VKLCGGVLPVALLVFSLLGCQSTPLRSMGLDGAPLPIDDARADEVLLNYFSEMDGRTGLRGSARVSLVGPDFNLNRPQRIVVERPGRVRFEVLALFDQLAAILVSDGDRYGFYDASTEKISRGYVTPRFLWDLAKIDLAPEQLVGLLLGAPEPSPGLARAGVWLEPDGRIVVAFAWPSGTPPAGCEMDLERGRFDSACYVDPSALADGGELFLFDREGRLVEIRSLAASGALRYRAIFEGYEALGGEGGVVFPKRVTIRSPGVESEARFDWKRVMLASDLSDRLFVLPQARRPGQGG
jgi:hypothetical protein